MSRFGVVPKANLFTALSLMTLLWLIPTVTATVNFNCVFTVVATIKVIEPFAPVVATAHLGFVPVPPTSFIVAPATSLRSEPITASA